MRILAFAASNSRNSINQVLLKYAVTRLKESIIPDCQVQLLNLNDYEMPIYSIDREQDSGVPDLAQDFFGRIGNADTLLISFAEHNGFVTAAWKNIFDWMSRINMKLWQGKPMIILSATPGPRAGAGVLSSQEMLAPHFGGDLRGKLGVGVWHEAWNPNTQSLTRTQDKETLDAILSRLIPEKAVL